MRWSSMVLLAPAAALATIWGCGSGGDTTAASGASGSGGALATTSGTGGATASGTGGGSAATSSGQGGGGGSNATTASASSSSAQSSGTGPSACTWSAVNPCGPGMYCDAPTCQQGTCTPTGGVETSDRTPVCGCDDVTYWNASVAQKQGQSIAKTGACAPGKTCGGLANLKCPGAATCAYQLTDLGQCNAADFGGNCWATPAVCPPVALGSKSHACGAATCADECTLIKKSTSYYPDSTCPQ